MNRFGLLLVLFILATIGFSVAEEMSQLASIVSRGSLEDIAKSLDSGNGEQWPEIASSQIDNHPEKKRIASLLLAKILQANIADPQSVVPALASLAERLKATGGYCNYVIADTAERLAVASLISALVTGDLAPEKAEQLAAVLPEAFPATDKWIRLLNQEMSFGEKADVLHTTRPEDYLNQLYALTEAGDVEDIYVKIGENHATSEKLLEDRDIAVLARNMAETETYRIAHLRALIFFLKHGGSLREIDLNDVRNVNDIFAKAPTFSSPLLRINRINAMHLKMMEDEKSSPEKRPRMLIGYE